MLAFPDFWSFFGQFKTVAGANAARGRSFFLVAGCALLGVAASAGADESDTFFDDSYVHEIRLTFADANWYSTLYNSHNSNPDDPSFPATFVGDGVEMGTIGVRFKGNSSFRVNSQKKSFKLDFDEYDEENDDIAFFGLKKLNLNNSYKDPTMLREKLFLDFASKYVPTIRSVHAKVYVNGEYLGLYLAVEQVDKTFIQSRFGSSEDGNLYKGAASDDLNNGPQSDFGSDLAWEGSSEATYHDHYQLKTNETADDYSGLVSFIDALNNGDPDAFPENLEPLLNVDSALASIAINSLFVNLDSYTGSAHNYFIYQSDSSGQFHHIFWDANESFGSFLQYWSGSNPLVTDPFWHPTTEPRPLMEQLWKNEQYKRRYLGLLARMLREGFDSVSIMAEANRLADIIRDDVYADNNKEYSNAYFEWNLTSNVGSVYGLQTFVAGRASYMASALDAYALQSDLRINEVAAGAGVPWLELYNAGVGSVSLAGLYLSDSAAEKTKWALPSASLEDGVFSAYWLDGDVSLGADHSSFALAPEGGTVYLFDSSGALLDSVAYPGLEDGRVFQRYPDGEDRLIYSDHSTRSAENQRSDNASVVLYINEIMAQNDATIQDPAGTGFPDWFELYNPNDYLVNLGGMYLSDNQDLPTLWKIPDGVSLEAGGYLVFWADRDEEQGPTHADFKLSTEGEEIGLYDTDINGNVEIDFVAFGLQTPDVSYGREYGNPDSFAFFDQPTPGFSNAGVVILSQLANYLVGAGYTMTLGVDYEGGGTLSFQWSLDDEAIDGATESTLLLDTMDSYDTGVYSVAISRGSVVVEGDIAAVSVETLDPDGDADGDGISNVVESAFGLNPQLKDRHLMPQFTIDGGVVSLAYSSLRYDIECVVEESPDLENWEPVEPVSVSSNLWSYLEEIGDATARFFRIRLEYKNAEQL